MNDAEYIRDSAATYAAIVYREADGIARLTLNRPDKLNAFSDTMFREMRDAIDRVEVAAARGHVRVLVLSGNGRGFCAGADLASIDPATLGDADLGTVLERDYNPFILRLRDLPIPVLCAVNGIAAGAGASLALAGDLTIATRSASFILAFARIGLVPDAGATFFLPQRIGRARALGLAMLGEKIDATTAADWGLVWQCVDDADFAATIDAYATRLAAAPTRAIVATRKLFDLAETNTLADQLAAERAKQAEAGRGSDFREGVTAFREKRPAVFRGR